MENVNEHLMDCLELLKFLNHSWVLHGIAVCQKFCRRRIYSLRIFPQILLSHVRNLAHKLGEDAIVLEIGCGAYAPFARWCAEAGVKQAAGKFQERT